jgi:hypothetical protein
MVAEARFQRARQSIPCGMRPEGAPDDNAPVPQEYELYFQQSGALEQHF